MTFEKKDAVVLRRRVQAAQLEQRSLARKCFWAWPWGHVWSMDVSGRRPRIGSEHCVVCGTEY